MSTRTTHFPVKPKQDQLVSKSTVSYGNRKVIIVFTRVRRRILRNQINLVHILASYSFQNHFNITLPPTTVLPTGIFVCGLRLILSEFLILSMRATSHTYLIILAIITLMLLEIMKFLVM